MTFYSHMPGTDKTRWSVGFLPVAANTITKVLGNRVVVGDNSQTRLTLYSSDGAQIGTIPLPLPAATDLRRLREAVREETIAQSRDPSRREYAEAAFDAPRALPRYQSFVPDEGGRLWIQLVADPADAPTRYLLLSPTGQLLGRYQLPPRSRVLTAMRSELLVVAENADGLQHVTVHKSPPP
jgi:hypothetical protein